ncbi:MAG: hypothetical protein IJS14_07245 [Lentisphaeria bacterium]|nr:hypothetical protein [Lentisphaeria bacterium]
MSNKLLLILLSCLLAGSAFAQKRYRPRTRRGQQTTVEQQKSTTSTTVQKPDEKKTADQKTAPSAPARTTSASSASTAGLGRFDPKKPGLTQKYVDYIMDGIIRKELLERKFPPKLPSTKRLSEAEDEEGENGKEKKQEKFRLLSQIDYMILLNRFRSLTKHFELTEVTNIRPVWFERYLAELSKFDPIVYQISLAVQERSDERYIRAVQLFKNQQEVCLRMLKEKKPGLTAEERVALQKKNAQIRIDNRRKQRQAELQRRQEQLKRRQEQQKQQQQKPAAPAAGK